MREGTALLHPPRVLPHRLRLQRLLFPPAHPPAGSAESWAARGSRAPASEVKTEKPGELSGTGFSLSVPLPSTIPTHAKAHRAPGEELVLESCYRTGCTFAARCYRPGDSRGFLESLCLPQ